ncbi:MAG: DUF924 family protein [Alphaproteobacteria bacterium]
MNDNFAPLETTGPDDVLRFWFTDGSQANWFDSSEVFDDLIRSKFLMLWEAACEGAVDAWADEAQGALALIIVLDQFTRNLNRESAAAWAQDDKALKFTKQAIDRGFDADMSPEERQFLYMPLMHSENLNDQFECLNLMRERVGMSAPILYAEKHLEVIEKFGRFPHRNDLLGREPSMAELAWVDQNGGF